MTRKKSVSIACSMAVVLAMAGSAPALDLGFGKFLPTKDEPTCCYCWADYVNMGANEVAFIKAFCGTLQMDFDRQGIGDIVSAYPECIVRLYLVTFDGGADLCEGRDYMPFTWCTPVEWGAEGDGYWDIVGGGQMAWNDYGDAINFNWHKFNWTQGTKPLTKWAVQTDHVGGVLNGAGSVQWRCPDGSLPGNPCADQAGYCAGTWPECMMECPMIGAFDVCGIGGSRLFNSESAVGKGDGLYTHVDLDAALVDDLTGNGRPDVFALGVGGALRDPVTQEWDWNWFNCWMATKEYAGSEPYIRVMWLGDANLDGCTDGGDYTLWADNYLQNPGANTWEEGDFNDDGNTDGADYTLWADHYGRGPGCPPQVPEPATLALLALGGVALIRRRR